MYTNVLVCLSLMTNICNFTNSSELKWEVKLSTIIITKLCQYKTNNIESRIRQSQGPDHVTVLYFDQRLGAAHAKRWLKYIQQLTHESMSVWFLVSGW